MSSKMMVSISVVVTQHQSSFEKSSKGEREAALLLIKISWSIGCSLKIHRVELALLMETAYS